MTTRSREALDQRGRGVTLTGSANRPWAGGTLNLNTRLNHERERYVQRITQDTGAATASRIDGQDDNRDGEVGGDWTRGIERDWTMKLVGLGRAESSDFLERLAAEDDASAFSQRARTTELVGRATVSRQGSHTLRPDVGGEIAWNRLLSRLAFTEAGTSVMLPGQRRARRRAARGGVRQPGGSAGPHRPAG